MRAGVGRLVSRSWKAQSALASTSSGGHSPRKPSSLNLHLHLQFLSPHALVSLPYLVFLVGSLQQSPIFFLFHLCVEGPGCIGTTSLTTADAATLATVTDLFQVPVNGERDVANNAVPMQLLNQTTQEGIQQMAALVELFPKAKIEGDRITATHYAVVLKLFLRDLMLSETGIEGMPHREAYALLLTRLSREIGSSDLDSNSNLDPANYAGCLDKLLIDLEQTWKRLETDRDLLRELEETWPDVCVFVRRETDKYTWCLLAAADALRLLPR